MVIKHIKPSYTNCTVCFLVPVGSRGETICSVLDSLMTPISRLGPHEHVESQEIGTEPVEICLNIYIYTHIKYIYIYIYCMC